MFCQYCGEVLPEGGRFCPLCGRPQPTVPPGGPDWAHGPDLHHEADWSQGPDLRREAGLRPDAAADTAEPSAAEAIPADDRTEAPSGDPAPAAPDTVACGPAPEPAAGEAPGPADAPSPLRDAPPQQASAPCAAPPAPDGAQTRSLRKPLLILCVLALLAAAGFGIAGIIDSLRDRNGTAEETPPSGQAVLSATEIARLSGSVLTLYVYDRDHELLQTGSGFVAFDDSTLVTNYHVIDRGYSVEAVSEQEDRYPLAGAVYWDPGADIAILRFESPSGLPVLELADSDQVEIGDTVYAIGSPLELKNTVSDGIVSAIRSEDAYYDLQITAPISAGSSGGALLDRYGRVIGITYASYDEGQNLNLAIPSVEFRSLSTDLAVDSFERILTQYRPMGNTYANYSSADTRLVEVGDTIYHSYNADGRIVRYSKSTGRTTVTQMYGTHLNVYDSVLYYLPPEHDRVCSYDLDTCLRYDDLLEDCPDAPPVGTISQLFVTDYGITVVYDAGFFDTVLLQFDLDGMLLGTVRELPPALVMLDDGVLAGARSDPGELVLVYLWDLDTDQYSLDFEPIGLSTCGGGVLYLSDASVSPEDLLAVDLYSIDAWYLQRSGAADGRSYPNGDLLYYASEGGTERLDCITEETVHISDLRLSDLCFTEDGQLYAAAYGARNEDRGMAADETRYFRMEADGSGLEELRY